MSGGLAPSKSTVYISNIPFSLTNNDINQIFAKFGEVVKVTIVKDKATRISKGVAFVLFLARDSALKAVAGVNGVELFGRKWKCSIANDNGRAKEFIRRKDYPDKSVCYECGAAGHLSYACPQNTLGDRDLPSKKEKKRRKREVREAQAVVRGRLIAEMAASDDEGDVGEDPAEDSLSAAIEYEHLMAERQAGGSGLREGQSVKCAAAPLAKRRKYTKSGYFSDEEDLDDGGGS